MQLKNYLRTDSLRISIICLKNLSDYKKQGGLYHSHNIWGVELEKCALIWHIFKGCDGEMATNTTWGFNKMMHAGYHNGVQCWDRSLYSLSILWKRLSGYIHCLDAEYSLDPKNLGPRHGVGRNTYAMVGNEPWTSTRMGTSSRFNEGNILVDGKSLRIYLFLSKALDSKAKVEYMRVPFDLQTRCVGK